MHIPHQGAETIAELLYARAQQQGSAPAYTYLADGRDVSASLTFAEVDVEARAVAARCQRHMRSGDRALILAEDAIGFVRAFMGCQHAGIIAVPVSSPFPSQRGRRIDTLRAIARDSGATAVLTSGRPELRGKVLGVAPEMADMTWLDVDDIDAAEAADFRATNVRSGDIAFLQYTSGSTSSPKGVMVTNAALMHNEEMLCNTFGYGPTDVIVSWLPLFHDMGLIGSLIPAVYNGIHAVLMPPTAFVQRPARWLRAITTYGGTVCGSPDFGYAMCVQRVRDEERADLDLTSWKVAFNGAEPVRAATLSAFADAFAPCGLDRGALYPAYGLAECTLIATGPVRGEGPTLLGVDLDALREGVVEDGDHVVVGCGQAWLDRRVEIVDPKTCRRAAPGTIGEIWIAGADVAAGYWNRPHDSERTFRARLADGDDGPFLRTGDLGFLRDGQLYIAGRLKDIVIVGGRNHYPHDIEASAQAADDAIAGGCVIAFAIDRGGSEQVVVVAELVPDRSRGAADVERIERAVRNAVTADHGIALDHVALVARKSVPKTSSGKLQRGACRLAFERAELVPAHDGHPVADLQEVA